MAVIRSFRLKSSEIMTPDAERRAWTKQVPSQKNSVLSGFNFKRLAAIHCPISSIHCCSKRTPLQTTRGSQCNNTCVSSAQEYRLTFQEAAISASSAMYKINLKSAQRDANAACWL